MIKYLVIFFLISNHIELASAGAIMPKTLVKAEGVKYYDFYNQFVGVGKCQFINSKDYYVKIDGTVDAVMVKQGTSVNKNEELIVIDGELAKTMLAEAEAAYKSAEANYNRDLSLLNKKIISEEAVTSSKVTLEQSRNALVKAKMQYENMIIQAQSSGYVGVVKAKVGDDVKVGDYLFSLISDGEKVIFLDLPEKLLGQIKSDAIVKTVDQTNKQITGKITAITDYVSATGTISLKAIFPTEAKLIHNSFIEVNIEYGHHKGLAIPLKTIMKNDKGNFIFKLSEGNNVKQLYITLGTVTNDQVEVISSDLKEGDMIIIEGLTKIQDGSQVELISSEITK